MGESELLYWVAESGREDEFIEKLKIGIEAIREKEIQKNGVRIKDSSYCILYKKWEFSEGEEVC